MSRATRSGCCLTQRFDGDGNGDCLGRARDTVAAFLDALVWTHPPKSPEIADDVLLVADELVTNSLRYAPGPLTLTVRDNGDALHVVVTDSSGVLPKPRNVDLATGDGIGWHVINALTQQLYAIPTSRGKSVHAVIAW